MKKTISINIAGLVFHIEEDGYEKLRVYLNAIQKYFATYEDSKEIISDIEGRVAERFLNKQKAADKQAIGLEDVEELIKAMGNVSDFEAVEEEEDLAVSGKAKGETAKAESEKVENSETDGYKYNYKRGEYAYSYEYDPKTGKRKTEYNYKGKPLVRDTKHKLLGGVCAGIAHYLNIDPLLTRLAFLFLFLGLPTFGGIVGAEEFFGPFSGVLFLLYIALWISFPASNTLEEDKNLKKFYRDSDQKVVGGVAAGVAAYFGIDTGVVRLLWVLSVALFGTGLVLYLILWAITPLAKTLTEKMEMTGQPITLENIETNVKRALQPDTNEENTFTKFLLLPFRAIAAVFRALTPLLKFVVVIARVFAGLILVMIGGGVLAGLLVALFAALGMSELPFGSIDNDFLPLNFFFGEVSPVAYFFFFLAVAVPFAALAWAGISLLVRQNKFAPAVWQTMLGLFLAGILGASIFGAKYGSYFSREGKVETSNNYALSSPLPLLTLNENDSDENYHNMSFDLSGHDANDLKVEMEKRAQGRSRSDAENNAKTIVYNILQNDSAIVFDEHFTIQEKAKFRAQRLNLKVYLPYNKPFRMTAGFYNEFGNRALNYNYGINPDNESEFKKLRWAIKPDSGLVCLDRNITFDSDDDSDQNEDGDLGSVSANVDENVESTLGAAFEESFNEDTRGEFVKQFEVKNFDKVNIAGAYVVKVRRGDGFKVTADGRESDVDKLQIRVENNRLMIENESKFNIFQRNRRVGLVITMPTLKGVSLSGATVGKIEGFDKLDNLDIDIAGASKTIVAVRAQKLDLSVSGASKVLLRGQANNLNADLAGACALDATAMQVQNADVSASGASKANFGKVPNLKSQTSGASKVEKNQ
jgi:phage shock protein PspC (stress-responsive transcriptional regulator)